VAHIRFSADEFSALEAAAARAELTISGFVRSLSMEGAGVRPFMNEADRAIVQLLVEDMRAIGNNLNQIARAINTGRLLATSEVTAMIVDASAISRTVAAELAVMTGRASSIRSGEVG
jgi:hypothetical protein